MGACLRGLPSAALRPQGVRSGSGNTHGSKRLQRAELRIRSGANATGSYNAQVGSFGTKRSYSRTRTSRLVIFARRRGRVRTLVSSHAGGDQRCGQRLLSLRVSETGKPRGRVFLPTYRRDRERGSGSVRRLQGTAIGPTRASLLTSMPHGAGRLPGPQLPRLLRQTRDGVLSPPSSNAVPRGARKARSRPWIAPRPHC
jgi:hypothetical protein